MPASIRKSELRPVPSALPRIGLRFRPAGLVLGILTSLTVAMGSLGGPFSRLQILLPGEIAAPNTPTGKTGSPFAQVTNVAFTLTVNAVDANWNLVATNDTVRILSSSTNVVLPGSAALVDGTRNFTVRMTAAGFASFTASNVTQSTTLGASPTIIATPPQPAAYTYSFTYSNRQALLAAGWSFLARTAAGATRNTENTNSAAGPVVSYNQGLHPGAVRIPIDGGDLWDDLNNSQNSLFHNLPFGWTSVQVELGFRPTQPYQQANLALYQDDDNYVELASVHDPAVSFVGEVAGVPSTLTTTPLVSTNLFLRLDREIVYGDIIAFYSQNGSNWLYAGRINQDLVNPRLCIWGGGSQSGNPTLDIRQVRIATNSAPITATLALQPLSLVFSCVAGQSITNRQRINIYRRGPDAFNWTVTPNAAWLSTSTLGGNIPGYCDVAVDTTGLTNGVYRSTLSFRMLGAVTNTVNLPVTLIVNPAQRATVATWRGGRAAAMSVWIDDSDTVMFSEMQAAGVTGTYALMGPGPQLSLFSTYHNGGMELGAHTHNHYCYPLDEPTRRAQLELNIADILSSTPQTYNRLTSFAWPCGANTTRERVWAGDYFLISRGYNHNQLEDPTPLDWMDVKSYNSHEHTPFPPADLKSTVDAAIAQGKWLNLVFHTMNNDDGAVAYSVGKDIWVGTGGDVTRYILQRDRTVISNYVESASQISFRCYRLPIPPSSLRSFESSFNSNDTLTFQVSVTNLPPVADVKIGGVSKPFTLRGSWGAGVISFDGVVTTNSQLVVVSLTTQPILTVTAANKTKVYRQPNPALTGSLTGVQSGDNITASFATSATPTSPVGNYSITPVFSDPLGRLGNYFVVTNLGTLTITKSNAPVTLAGLAQTFTGVARAATATTVPSGLTVNFTYNGGSTAPINAGSYQVIATISDVNHFGSATNTLVVAKSNAPITLGGINQIYNGGPLSVTANTVPAGLPVNRTYNGSNNAPTNVGNYLVVASINHSNYSGAITNTLVIAPSNAAVVLGNLAAVYDGSAKSASAVTEPAGLTVNLTYNGSVAAPTNAGSYEVIGVISEVNYVGSATNTLVIAPSNAAVVLGNLAAVYDGSAKSASAVTEPAGLTVNLTYNGNVAAPTNAGSYEVVGVIQDVNYAGSATNTLVVAKAIAEVNFDGLVALYDGAAHEVSVMTEPGGLSVVVTYDGLSSAPTNAGSYEVIATVVDFNFQGAGTNYLTVTKSNAAIILSQLKQVADGTPRIVSVTTAPAALPVSLTYEGSPLAPLLPGTYQVVGLIADPNYHAAATNLLQVADPNFAIQEVRLRDDGNVQITWPAVANFAYQLQFKEDLDATNWQAFPPLIASDSIVTVTNNTAGSTQRFYRVLLLP